MHYERIALTAVIIFPGCNGSFRSKIGIKISDNRNIIQNPRSLKCSEFIKIIFLCHKKYNFISIKVYIL